METVVALGPFGRNLEARWAWSTYGSIQGSGYKIARKKGRGEGGGRGDKFGPLMEHYQGQGAGLSCNLVFYAQSTIMVTSGQ